VRGDQIELRISVDVARGDAERVGRAHRRE
jgi:hypothetical protein